MPLFDFTKLKINDINEFEKYYKHRICLHKNDKIVFNLSFFIKSKIIDNFSEQNLDDVIKIIKDNISREFIIVDSAEPIFPYIENISTFIKICKTYNKSITILTGQKSEDIISLYESLDATVIFLPLFNFHCYSIESVYSNFSKENTLEKKFLSLNRVRKPSREALRYFLKQNDLLKFGEYSFIFANDKSFEEEINIADNSAFVQSMFDKLDFNKKCFLNFVIESVNEDYFIFNNQKIKTNFVSEKTLKAVYTPLPFILLGEQNILHYLKSYGIKTFSDFWDESYDLEENVLDRQLKSFNILKNICYENNSVIREMYNQVEKIHKENVLIVESIMSDNLKLLKEKIDL